MRKQPYHSCNCLQCRNAPSSVKKAHKKIAHKKLRRQVRRAVRLGVPEPDMVDTGYKS